MVKVSIANVFIYQTLSYIKQCHTCWNAESKTIFKITSKNTILTKQYFKNIFIFIRYLFNFVFGLFPDSCVPRAVAPVGLLPQGEHCLRARPGWGQWLPVWTSSWMRWMASWHWLGWPVTWATRSVLTPSSDGGHSGTNKWLSFFKMRLKKRNKVKVLHYKVHF